MLDFANLYDYKKKLVNFNDRNQKELQSEYIENNYDHLSFTEALIIFLVDSMLFYLSSL